MLKKTITIITAALALSLLLFGYTTMKQANKFVGIYYYPWYSPDGRHWDASIDPTWAVVEKPVIGFYDSRDEHVIRWQLKLIRDAGIDFIAISWWGPESFEDEATRVVVRYLREYGLKFTILIEPYLGGDPAFYDKGFWESTLSYIRANFIEPHGDVYMQLHGRPLVLAFNPIGLSYRPHQDFPEYTIRIVGNDIDNAKYQDWDLWPDYLVNALSVELRIRVDNVVSVVPRYCDTHFRNPGTCIDPDLSQQLYKRQWDWILKNADKVSIVMITSWNEYHERTHIEPSHTSETGDPWLLYNLTKEFIALFKTRSKSTYIASTLATFMMAMLILGIATMFALKPTRHHASPRPSHLGLSL